MHYFSCSGVPSAPCIFHKKCAGTHYAELVFLHAVGSAVTLVNLVHPGREISMHYFLGSGGPNAVSIENASGHVTPNLCFCIRWDRRVT
jgi:hypothetical protein